MFTSHSYIDATFRLTLHQKKRKEIYIEISQVAPVIYYIAKENEMCQCNTFVIFLNTMSLSNTVSI